MAHPRIAIPSFFPSVGINRGSISSIMRLHLRILVVGLSVTVAVSAQPYHSPDLQLSGFTPVLQEVSAHNSQSSSEIQEHLRKAQQYLQRKQPAQAVPEFAAV